MDSAEEGEPVEKPGRLRRLCSKPALIECYFLETPILSECIRLRQLEDRCSIIPGLWVLEASADA